MNDLIGRADVPDTNVGDIALPRWIPITERKPDDGYRVIVTDFGYVEVARWFDGRWYDIDGNTLKGVTAWMPLPQPWKGADDEAD